MAGSALVTQLLVEVLTVSGGSLGDILVTQLLAEVLTYTPTSGVSLTAQLLWDYSGVSGQNTLVLARGTQATGAWVVSGASAHTYLWTFGGVSNYAGFASTATTSSVTRTFSVAGVEGAFRAISSTISAQVLGSDSTLTSATGVHVTAITVPNSFDGLVVKESQRARRVWPL